MKKLTLEELREVQIGILKYIDKVCKENNLTYFLNYGSLIGAVRHKGFIPWDDDVDISMPREDYEKFIKICENKKNDKYEVWNYENTSWYYNPFLVVIDNTTIIPDKYKKERQDTSCFVDVFPIDKFNDTKFIKKIKFLTILQSVCYRKRKYLDLSNVYYKKWMRIILFYILYFVKPRFFTKLILKLIKNNTTPNGKLEGFIACGDSNEVFKSGIYGGGEIKLEFEKEQFYAPKNYHIILTGIYGDYMTPPPKDKQIPPHGIDVYYK